MLPFGDFGVSILWKVHCGLFNHSLSNTMKVVVSVPAHACVYSFCVTINMVVELNEICGMDIFTCLLHLEDTTLESLI